MRRERSELTQIGEQERRGALRPIHRYSRVERFISVVYQLLGERGDVPETVLEVVRHWGFDEERDLIWNSIRFILKQYNWARYYNRIPSIINLLGLRRKKIDFWRVQNVIEKFKEMSFRFDTMKSELPERSYFPNLRYVALRLLEENGVRFSFEIPKIRTKRKLKGKIRRGGLRRRTRIFYILLARLKRSERSTNKIVMEDIYGLIV